MSLTWTHTPKKRGYYWIVDPDVPSDVFIRYVTREKNYNQAWWYYGPIPAPATSPFETSAPPAAEDDGGWGHAPAEETSP